MEDLIKKYIEITIDVILVSLILGVIIVLSVMSKSLMSDMILQRETVKYIEEYNKFYMYDDKIVNGSDVVDAVVKYARYYSFEIVIGSKTYKIDLEEEKVKGSQIWTVDYLENVVLKDDIFSKFKATLVRDIYGYISGIKFVKQ